MRPIAAALAGLCALAGCGGSSPAPRAPVRLSIDTPLDQALLREGSVELRGRVSPRGADVTVEGRRVAVRAGRFSSRVGLAPGANLVDVFAGSAGAVPAMVALRVRREVDVRVPELTGNTPSDAQDALAGLGLQADVKKAGGIIEFLLPEQARVCDSDPPSGQLVPPGTVVTVHVAKSC